MPDACLVLRGNALQGGVRDPNAILSAIGYAQTRIGLVLSRTVIMISTACPTFYSQANQRMISVAIGNITGYNPKNTVSSQPPVAIVSV